MEEVKRGREWKLMKADYKKEKKYRKKKINKRRGKKSLNKIIIFVSKRGVLRV